MSLILRRAADVMAFSSCIVAVVELDGKQVLSVASTTLSTSGLTSEEDLMGVEEAVAADDADDAFPALLDAGATKAAAVRRASISYVSECMCLFAKQKQKNQVFSCQMCSI